VDVAPVAPVNVAPVDVATVAPVNVAPVAPVNVAPVAAVSIAPLAPVDLSPVAPVAPVDVAPVGQVAAVEIAAVGAPASAGPVILATTLVPDAGANGAAGAAPAPAAAISFTTTTGVPIQTAIVNPGSTSVVLNNVQDNVVITHNIVIDVAISNFTEALSIAAASAAATRIMSDASILGGLN
jgi:hypothetical protein